MDFFLNDKPIVNLEEDLYDTSSFATMLAKSLLGIKEPIGTTIALHGPWGSGKSSTTNLIRSKIEECQDSNLIVSEFKCLWFRGEEALAVAFLEQLNAELAKLKNANLKTKLKRYGLKALKGLTHLTVDASMKLISNGTGLDIETPEQLNEEINKLFPEDTLEASYKALYEAMEKSDKRFLIIIDDLDRLYPEESLAIFRLLRSVGHLPNIMYLVVFDRELMERVIKEKYPSDEEHFLEKIIQVGFELPLPSQYDLNEVILKIISKTNSEMNDEEEYRVQNVFLEVIVPYLKLPRQINRWKNAISMTWPVIAGELNFADFLILEVIRLYEHNFFLAIRENKNLLFRKNKLSATEQSNIFLSKLTPDRQEVGKMVLRRLFPQHNPQTTIEETQINNWTQEKRVCIEAYFDTYFRLCLSDQVLPSDAISKLLASINNKEIVKQTFREAANARRKSGGSHVPLYLDELIGQADRIKDSQIKPFISVLSEIHDEIDLTIDSGFHQGVSFMDTDIRYYLLFKKLTNYKYSLKERTKLYLDAMETASLGWLIYFIDCVQKDYQDNEKKPRDEEDLLVDESALEKLDQFALTSILDARDNNKLLQHKDFHQIMYKWVSLTDDDPNDALKWTNSLLKDHKMTLKLVKASEGFSWSAPPRSNEVFQNQLFRRKFRSRITYSTPWLDVKKFFSKLEDMLKEDTLSDSERKAIENLISKTEKTNSDIK